MFRGSFDLHVRDWAHQEIAEMRADSLVSKIG